VCKLNEVIEKDEILGAGFRIGHSYFCTNSVIDDMWLQNVVKYQLEPLIKEYWFDEPNKVKEWTANLRSAIQ
jgi:5-methylcytosine-specific restriction protein B